MENEDYRIINVNDTMIKCFRDGRIHKLCKVTNPYCKKGEWNERTNKPNTEGYIQIKIGGKKYYAHRLIMLAFAGQSEQHIDHINRIKNDNRFENLRYVSPNENNLNREYVENAKGYYRYKNKWRAMISINCKQKYLGVFEKEEDARQAYLDARAYRS
jgi:hypothetical protein